MKTETKHTPGPWLQYQMILDAYETWNQRKDGGEDDLHYSAKQIKSAITKARGE